jgi:KDO2-lipid IV(A) lauroyltransferase
MWLEASLLRGVFWLLERLSIEQALKLGAICFGLAGPHTSKAKKVERNLKIAFPELSKKERDAIGRKTFRHLGMAAAELVKMRQIWEQRDLRLEFVLEPGARDYLANGRPAVMVTAHVGAWQITCLIARHMGFEMGTVYAEESNPGLRELFHEFRGMMGTRLIPSSAGVRPLIKELSAGHCIALANDTRLDSGELIPYFGIDALTSTTPARLALRSGVALIAVSAERRLPGYYRIKVHNPIEAQDRAASRDEQAISITRQINEQYEAWVRDNPEQWMCLKRRWPKPGKL